MNTGPKRKVAPSSLNDNMREEIEAASSGRLPDLTVRELLGLTLSALARAERTSYLAEADGDRGNGTYRRGLSVGSIPVDIDVPRTRSGAFRPASIPQRYARGYPDETQNLLLGLLSSSRSVNAAKAAIRDLGLPVSEEILDEVAQDFIDELDLRNTRPIDTDLLAIFIDAKYVELKEGGRLRPMSIYVVVGLGRDGKKRIIACVAKPGREVLDEWKQVLRSLCERGLRRVLIVVQDDFSGLSNVTKSLFPGADVQLCIVHLQRNAQKHLTKTEAAEFHQRIRTIRAAWDEKTAGEQFDDLCEHFSQSAKSFITEVEKKRDHYLAFLKYPTAMRRTFCTTNAVEAVNGRLEVARLNSGGYFQSLDALKMKLGAAVLYLENGTWRRISGGVACVINQLNIMFESRFEQEN